MKAGKIIQASVAFVAAFLASALLASLTATQVVLADLQRFGLDVTWSERVAATLHDIIGLAIVLPLMMAPALLVAFIVAALGHRFLGGNRTFWYMAAGFASIPAELLLIKTLLGATPLAAARTGFGMFLIALCSLAGGWLFARVSRPGDN